MILLDLVKLTALMQVTTGRPEIRVGLIDGPVATHHPDLASENIRTLPGPMADACKGQSNIACLHGTLVAGVLTAKRGSLAPAICPECTLLVRPIFAASEPDGEQLPSAAPEALTAAITEVIDAGASVINLSAALVYPSARGEREIQKALDYAANSGVIIVVAAGNQANVGGTSITRHPWVIPVVACDFRGRPLEYSNLGNSIGRHGLSAPGDKVASLGLDGKSSPFSGTSAAAPFVTGAVALLFSEFPNATGAEVRLAVGHAHMRRKAIVPPLLDAWSAYQFMLANHGRR